MRGLFGAERSGLRILMLPAAVGACRLVLVVHFGCYQLSRAQTTRIGSAHLPLEEKNSYARHTSLAIGSEKPLMNDRVSPPNNFNHRTLHVRVKPYSLRHGWR